MTKKIYMLLLVVVALFVAQMAKAQLKVDRVEPANWWVGMKNKQLQLMVYGTRISDAKLAINYAGVKVNRIVKTDNANYLFVYLDIAATTKPGMVPLNFTSGTQKTTYNYPLKARTDKSGALGFTPADVLYLITPDRFANANPANDDLLGVKVNRTSPNARHGGDLAGVVKYLDYMKDLGITTVWLNPIQENGGPGGSYHGYAITDFYNMDPRYGSNEEFRDLTKVAHQKGLKMVMDMVLNHCGSSHWWFKDMPSKDWINNGGVFMQTNHATVSVMDVHASQTEKKTFLDGWFTRGMPDLNQRNPHLATYLIQNTIWWIEYARIDGIRQDTYSYMDFDFLARWNREVYAEYPNFDIVGETWYNKSTSPAWWQSGTKLGLKDPSLKTPMNFSLTFITQKAFDAKEEKGLDNIFEDIAQDFIYPDPYHMLTFLDNHDLSRFSRKEDSTLNRYKQGIAFLLTMRGIPQLYYGTEVLMTGTKEEGDGRLRKDFPGGWAGDKDDQFTKSGRTPMQNEAFDYLQKLLIWRKTNPAITQGKMIHYAPKGGIYVYGRIKDNHRVVVVLNSGEKEQVVKTDRFTDIIGSFKTGKDVITGKEFDLATSVTIPARGELVLDLK